MLTVVLDTNVVHRNPWLTRDDAPKLVQLAASGVCEVVYPRVVIEELTRQRVESARDAHDAATAGVKQMGVAGVDVTDTAALLQAAHGRIEAAIDDAFTAVLTKGGVREIPVPEVEATDLLERDLGRRRPFLEDGKTKKSLGFRDVLIWESVLELLRASAAGDIVFFVTFDAGFLTDDKKSLHPDLLEDLDRLGIPGEKVRLARGIPEAISLVEDFLSVVEPEPAGDVPEESSPSGTADAAPGGEPSPSEETPAPDETEVPAAEDTDDTAPTRSPVEIAVDERKQMRIAVSHAALVEAATDALYGLASEVVSQQLVYGGDYGYPSFVLFGVPALEFATIAGIHQTAEFSFAESTESPDVLVATAEAVITLEGALHRADWIHADGAVSISAQINEDFLEASAEVDVKVVVEIDIEGGRINVLDIVLEDLPTAPVNGADQLEFDFFDVESPDGDDDGRPDEP